MSEALVVEPTPEVLDETTVFDAASLTKPVVTATLVQWLREHGQLDIDAPLQRYLPDCGGPDKAGITLRQLLTHSSGLPASLPGNGAGDWAGPAAAVAAFRAPSPRNWRRFSEIGDRGFS